MAPDDLNRELLDSAEAHIRQRLVTDLTDAQRSGTLRIRQRLREEKSLLRFDLRRLGTPHGQTPSPDARAFHQEIGLAPGEFLLRLKMEAARELLRHPRFKIWQIADALGYSSQQAFSRGFKKVFGVTASALAKELTPADPAPTPSTELTDDRAWYAATVGALDRDSLRGLTDRLRQVADDGDGDILCFQGRDNEAESQVAEEIWSMLEPLSAPERKRRVIHVIRTNSPAFFELLGKKYRVALSRDAREAEELADLALAHLEVNADRLGDALPSLEALAWAWRGHAIYTGMTHADGERADGERADGERADGRARRAFRLAWQRWAATNGQGEARVEAQICLYEGYFLFAQQRDEDARARLDRAIVLARLLGLSGMLVEALMQRLLVLSLRRSLEEVRAEADLVLAELQRTGLDAACVFVYTFLSAAFTKAGRHREAHRYSRMSLLEI